MKFIFYVLALLLLAAPCNAEFRGYKWGTPMTTIKSSMGKSPSLVYPDALAYEDSLLGMDVGLNFYFESDKLSKGGYATLTKHKDLIDYLVDYSLIKQALINKYGPPLQDTEEYVKTKYDSNLSAIFKAISNNDIRLSCQWETKESVIILTIKSSKSSGYSTVIAYQELANEEKVKKRLKIETDKKL